MMNTKNKVARRTSHLLHHNGALFVVTLDFNLGYIRICGYRKQGARKDHTKSDQAVGFKVKTKCNVLCALSTYMAEWVLWFHFIRAPPRSTLYTLFPNT